MDLLYWIILLALFIPLATYIIKKTSRNPVRDQRLEQIQQRLREKARSEKHEDDSTSV